MTTDQLIQLLATDLEPVDPKRISRALTIALAIGAAAAFGAMFLVLGRGDEIIAGNSPGLLSIKLLFTLSVVASAAVSLSDLARPGAEECYVLAFVSVPFVAMLAL